MTRHTPHFVISSARSALLRCSCKWELPLPKVEVSPLNGTPIKLFFQAGFDIGREFENHVMGAAIDDPLTPEQRRIVKRATQSGHWFRQTRSRGY